MKVFVLTSSRADYGIYRPLLHQLKESDSIELKIVAFGTHLSRYHGYTLDGITKDGFEVNFTIESMLLTDSQSSIATSIGLTIQQFVPLWEAETVDLIICLGDRYEMFAAVSSSVPFNIPVAHIHGGETTLGAIDDKFRHAMTIMSSLHFAATKEYCDRIESICGSKENIYNVGALGLDNLDNIPLYTKAEFSSTYNIDLTKKTILSTYHPETVGPEKNVQYIQELLSAFEESTDFQIVITMPNTDTMGSLVRQRILESAEQHSHIIPVESLGTKGYFSCIKHCSFLVGNTSSGLIEAPSLGKYAINIGDRQKGRARGENVIDVPVSKNAILSAIRKQADLDADFEGENVYYKKGAAKQIIAVLQNHFYAGTHKAK